MIKIENEKNQQLRILGQKYNEVNLAYNQVITNIKAMEEYDMHESTRSAATGFLQNLIDYMV